MNKIIIIIILLTLIPVIYFMGIQGMDFNSFWDMLKQKIRKPEENGEN